MMNRVIFRISQKNLLCVWRDKTEKTVDDGRNSSRIYFIIIFLFVIWGSLWYGVCVVWPMKTVSRFPLPNHLSWMVSQHNLSKYIVPDHNTSLLLPRFQCNGSVYIVVVVCSAVRNIDARNAIRNTWAQYAANKRNLRVFFLLGKSANETVNAAVVDESHRCEDIIQEDFLDTYNNLTLKSVMLLKWVNQKCGNAKFVMKSDDDMFVNLPNLIKFLKTKGHDSLLVGDLQKNSPPVRHWRSKWYVSDLMFPGRVYPPYLSGTGYVLSRKIVPVLYRTALRSQFFYIEDVFITGMCAKEAGLTPVHHVGFNYQKWNNDYCIFKSRITVHKMTPKELLKTWQKLPTPSSVKCNS